MKLPKMCQKSVSFDREDAGWYVRNSVVVGDIKPDWRLPGGGVLSEYLTQDTNQAFDRAIVYSQHRVDDAQRHLRKLKKAKDNYNK